MASLLLVTGCSGTMYPRYLGIRPDAPPPVTKPEIVGECERRHPGNAEKEAVVRRACEGYYAHVEWAQQLAESYRTRATMNEWSIYLAGTIALGAASAVAGLGLAAAAATETIGLIGLSSGFASGFFGLLNNPLRAGFYTVAANDVASALDEGTRIVASSEPTGLGEAYRQATALLSQKVHRAVNVLETKRYEAAAAAASAVEREEAAELLNVARTAAVTDATPVGDAATSRTVALTLSGIELSKYKDRIMVQVDGQPTKFAVDGAALKVDLPEGKSEVAIRVFVGQVPIRGERIFKYR